MSKMPAPFPPGSVFRDVEGKPIVSMPGGKLVRVSLTTGDVVPFSWGGGSWSDPGDVFTRAEFESWLRDGFNRFDEPAERIRISAERVAASTKE